MLPQRHYARAPITEAIIDLRVELFPDKGVSELGRFGEQIAEAYPRSKRVQEATGRFQFGEGLGASVDAKHIGFILSSADERNVVQARLNGFTFSRLAPYESWEPFRDEARRLWNTYRAIVTPTLVTRLAVRYINRLDLPLPVRDFSDYLRVFPEVSTDLPQGLAGYFLRLAIPQDDIGATLLLNETIVPPAKPDVVSVVLDIDVFRTEDIPVDDAGQWDFLEVLRRRKNKVFEASITDLARELII